MTAVSAVVDASVVTRAFVSGSPSAVAWIERIHRRSIETSAPELLFAEVGNAVALSVRAGGVSEQDAGGIIRLVQRLPIRAVRLRGLVDVALPLALERGLSVCDACYLALAEHRDTVLVTADRRLAEAAPRAELISD